MENKINKNIKSVDNFIVLISKQYIYREKCYGNMPTK